MKEFYYKLGNFSIYKILQNQLLWTYSGVFQLESQYIEPVDKAVKVFVLDLHRLLKYGKVFQLQIIVKIKISRINYSFYYVTKNCVTSLVNMAETERH